MTRIIAGSLKGRRLATPPGDRTRPTSDRVREALFNSLAPGGDLDGLRFADLYAGSGAVGLEALSRGAAAALLVESHAQTAKVLRRNIADLAVTGADVICAPVEKALQQAPAEPFDIVFADPPYAVDRRRCGRSAGSPGRPGLARDRRGHRDRARRQGRLHRVAGEDRRRRVRRYGSTTLCYGHAL